jgi:hypothetical protein
LRLGANGGGDRTLLGRSVLDLLFREFSDSGGDQARVGIVRKVKGA